MGRISAKTLPGEETKSDEVEMNYQYKRGLPANLLKIK